MGIDIESIVPEPAEGVDARTGAASVPVFAYAKDSHKILSYELTSTQQPEPRGVAASRRLRLMPPQEGSAVCISVQCTG